MTSSSPDRIHLSLPELPTRIGALEGENLHPQPVRVSLTLFVDLQAASESGALEDTVDYSVIHSRAVELITSRIWVLIEELAGALVLVCLADRRIEATEVSVCKCQPPLGDGAGPVEVVLRRERDRG